MQLLRTKGISLRGAGIFALLQVTKGRAMESPETLLIRTGDPGCIFEAKTPERRFMDRFMVEASIVLCVNFHLSNAYFRFAIATSFHLQ